LVDSGAIQELLQTLTRDQYAHLAKAYFEQAPQTARRLRAALRDGQPLDLRANAHAAKGAALNLGFSAVAATAHALQQGAAHLPAHEIARLVQHFDDQTQATLAELLAQGLVAPVPAGVS
jgi:HPt (histidine-containing phosphotransfer) domain-containing protein